MKLTDIQAFDPKSPVAVPKVKPIEWGETSYGNPEAYTVAGCYRINPSENGGWTVIAGRAALRDESGRTNFASMSEAKDAAQADFERRILSALQSQEPKQ